MTATIKAQKLSARTFRIDYNYCKSFHCLVFQIKIPRLCICRRLVPVLRVIHSGFPMVFLPIKIVNKPSIIWTIILLSETVSCFFVHCIISPTPLHVPLPSPNISPGQQLHLSNKPHANYILTNCTSTLVILKGQYRHDQHGHGIGALVLD